MTILFFFYVFLFFCCFFLVVVWELKSLGVFCRSSCVGFGGSVCWWGDAASTREGLGGLW